MKAKHKFYWRLPVFTLLVMAAGAFLPYGISFFQDRYIMEARENRSLEPVSLTLYREGGVERALELIAENAYVRTAWDGDTNLSATEAIEAAKEVLELLWAEELISESALAEYSRDIKVQISPAARTSYFAGGGTLAEKVDLVSIASFLCISGDGSLNIGIWECVIQDKYRLWIDDASGKMVKFRGTSPFLDFSADDAALIASLLAERWRKVLENYYELDISDCIPVHITDDGMEFQMRCSAGGHKFDLPFVLNLNSASFN